MSFSVFYGGQGGTPRGGLGPGLADSGTPPAGGGPGGLLQRFCLRSLFLGAFRHFLGWDPPGTRLGPPWDPPGTPLGPPWDPPGTPLGPPWDPPGTLLGLPWTAWDLGPPWTFVTSNRRAFLDPPPPHPLGTPLRPPDTPSQEFARFWSKIQKTRDHPEPSISVLKNRIFNWDPGRSWGPPHLGCFWRQTFPFKGGSEFEARGGLRRLFCL